MTCSTCNGEKTIEKNILVGDNNIEMDVMVDCPDCDGSGIETSNYRLREYRSNGSTGYFYSSDCQACHDRLDKGVDDGTFTGGGIDEYVTGFGWVVVC